MYLHLLQGKFVLAEFTSKRGTVEYVGLIEAVLPKNEFFVNFLKQYNNRKNEFCFPNVLNRENVHDDNIISVLPDPQEKRGRFIFPYDILLR